jgi:hypothetical protein
MAAIEYRLLENLPRAEIPTDPRFIDLTGKVYGRLTVLWFAERRGINKTWACECACGSLVVVRGTHLANGHTSSCGCYRREQAAKHGRSHTFLYNVWVHVLDRCLNMNSSSYPGYGGRGIGVDFTSLDEFCEYIANELGERPSQNHSLDRINNLGNYAPGNLRWATESEQCCNRRSNHLVAWDGREMPLVEACELAGLTYSTVLARINKLGWPPEKALSTPIRPIKRKQPC